MSTLSKATVLALFMPVVAGQGGNAGTQTATIAVRSIALGDLDVADLFRACRKEILVAMANGLAIGLLAALASYAWKQNEALSLVLGAALFLNICAATLGGVLIPLGLKAMQGRPRAGREHLRDHHHRRDGLPVLPRHRVAGHLGDRLSARGCDANSLRRIL